MSPVCDNARAVSLTQRALVAAISAYQRHLSGRGPLRSVTCTFASTESCSAHGLRMAQTAPSVIAALKAMVGRLGRCRRASLYRLQGGNEVVWDELYDDLDADRFSSTLNDELPETRAALVWAARIVADRCGAAHRLRRDLADLAKRPPRSDQLLTIRSDTVLRQRPSRGLWWELVFMSLLLLPAFLLWGSAWMLALFVAAAVVTVHAVVTYIRRKARVESLLDATELVSFARLGDGSKITLMRNPLPKDSGSR